LKIDKVAGMEARGFHPRRRGGHQVSAGFQSRSAKRVSWQKRVTIAIRWNIGLDEMEMHEDAVSKGERVIL